MLVAPCPSILTAKNVPWGGGGGKKSSPLRITSLDDITEKALKNYPIKTQPILLSWHKFHLFDENMDAYQQTDTQLFNFTNGKKKNLYNKTNERPQFADQLDERLKTMILLIVDKDVEK